MHSAVLPPRARRLWGALSKVPSLRTFYLAGGSGLALHLGHRESEDLDFFSRRSFCPDLLAKSLARAGTPEHISLGHGSVECWLRGFKVQLLHYPYRRLEDLHQTKWGRLADPLDIVLMKLTAISQQGSKRDFVDLACFLRSYPRFPLGELLELLLRKYGRINRAHYLGALVYFQDADREPALRMRRDLNWKEVKSQLEHEVREFLR
jgi:hypothetical protein